MTLIGGIRHYELDLFVSSAINQDGVIDGGMRRYVLILFRFQDKSIEIEFQTLEQSSDYLSI